LYFGNMPRIEPQSAHDQEIQELFAEYVPGVTISAVSKQISPRPAPKPELGNNQYYCFVDLERAEDVDAVIEAMDGKQGSWGGSIKVNRARNSERKVVKEQGLQNQERRAMPEGSWRR
jgi:RNA recognition motif-containing protein